MGVLLYYPGGNARLIIGRGISELGGPRQDVEIEMQGGLAIQVTATILFGTLLASLLILTNAKAIGEKLQIMDHPDLVRKKHAQVTPLVGGLAIMVPLVLWAGASMIWNPSLDQKLLQVVLLCGGGATLVGYADDQSSTSPSSRLLSLLLLSVIALIIDPTLMPSQLNWENFPATAVPQWLGMVLISIGMAGYVNAVNMADGQNGIVTGMFAIWAVCLVIVTGGSGSNANIAMVVFETVVRHISLQHGGACVPG